MQSSNIGNNKEPLTDLAYDWVTIIQHKSEALRAYEQYMNDAQKANSPECLELMRKIYESDARYVQEATQHLMQVLSGQMGEGQRQMGQVEPDSKMRQGQMGQMGQTGQGQMGQGKMGQTGQRR